MTPVTHMSNETQHSRNSGDSRRRRSRGGNKNRNQNKHQGDQRGPRDERRNSNRSEEFRPQGPRPPRGQVPVKLTLWQKLLKAVGLYKAPARPERSPQPQKSREEARPPKSNTRNARTNEGDAPDERSRERSPERSGERPPRTEGRGRDRDRDRDRPRGGDPSTVESPRVYVGNLSYDVSEQDLQELFKGVGPVRNVEIVYNRTTHRSKGYGFVEMLHMDEAIRAVEVLNDQHFMGRKMTVSGAKSKGQDEREESEDRSEGPAAKVVLAPLPAAVEPDPAAVEETVIQTIVENVSPEEPSAEAMVLEEETPAPETTEEPALAEVAAESTEEAPAAEEETKTEVA